MRKSEHDEPAYEGRAGRTRRELVHFEGDDGRARSVAVPRTLNLAADPHLREPLLAGALHRTDQGVELAVPTVVHDPASRRVVLYLPEPVRHQALAARARWLAELADDVESPIPRYAQQPVVAVGLAALRTALSTPATTSAPASAEASEALAAREQQLTGREQALATRDEQLTGREQALATRERALATREQELTARDQAFASGERGFAERDAELRQREQAVEGREQAALQREEAVQQREQRLRERAEQVTRREDELLEKQEEHEAAQRDLAMRESELEARLQSLVDRERATADRERVLTASSAGAIRAVDVRKVSESGPPRAPSPIAALVPDDEVEELDELEPVSTNPGREGEAPSAISLVAPRDAAHEVTSAETRLAPSELVEDVDDVEELDDVVEAEPTGVGKRVEAELVEDDDVAEELSDDAVEEVGRESFETIDPAQVETLEGSLVEESGTGPDRTGIHTLDDELAAPRTAIATGALLPPDRLERAVPAGFEERELAWRIGEGVELWVRVAAGRDPESLAGDLDLLIQLAPSSVGEGARGLVLLTLLDVQRKRVARAVLDLREPSHKQLLDALRRKFEARVLVHDGSIKLTAARVGAPRELNVARILDRASKLRTEPSSDEARAEALALPLVLPDAHPLMGEELERASDAAGVRAVVAQVADALSAERLDEAIVLASVPRDAIDATVARLVERALAHGLALPTVLVERAVATGLAADVGELVARQIAAFRTTLSRGEHGLEADAIADNWEKLLALAADNEVAIDSDTHDTAHRAISDVRGARLSVPPGAPVDAQRIAEAGIPELVLMLEHPRYRRDAAIALAERGGVDHIDQLCKAARKMPRAEVVRVVPHIARIGEEAGDALIDGLSAKKTFVRHAFALALAHLKLRRAVVPLLHLMLAEQSEVWKDIARLVGTFGNASLRALTRQISDGKGPDDRIALALAHLALHGSEDAITQLRKDADPRVVRIAEQALAQREAAREREERVGGKRALDPADGPSVFARHFVAELEGKALDAELQDEV